MVATSSKEKKGLEMLVRGMEWKAPDFKLCPAITKSIDLAGAQSRIISKVLLINNIHSHFHCTTQEIGKLEMDETLNALTMNWVLKPKHKHLGDKGLTHITHMPHKFSMTWIRVILS